MKTQARKWKTTVTLTLGLITLGACSQTANQKSRIANPSNSATAYQGTGVDREAALVSTAGYTVVNEQTITNKYNSLGQLEAQDSDAFCGNPAVYGIVYDEHGRVKSKLYGNSYMSGGNCQSELVGSTEYTYYSASGSNGSANKLQAIKFTHGVGDANNNLFIRYEGFDDLGNIKQMKMGWGNEDGDVSAEITKTFDYDRLGQLEEFKYWYDDHYRTGSYVYNDLGNRTISTVNVNAFQNDPPTFDQIAAGTPPDLDGDGTSDRIDPDIDGDGCLNVDDPDPLRSVISCGPDKSIVRHPDRDGDGIADALDPNADGDHCEELIGHDSYPMDPTMCRDSDNGRDSRNPRPSDGEEGIIDGRVF